MEHCFISGAAQLQSNWREAFGSRTLMQDTGLVFSDRSAELLYWLDWDTLGNEAANAALQDLLGSGFRVVVMSAHPDAAQGMAFFGRGVRGYCHQHAVASQLREIALVIEHGGVWVGAEAMQRLLRGTLNLLPRASSAGNETLLGVLTAKEQAVAAELAKGASNREIAEILDISERTVKAHLSTIFEKLDVRDRVQLALLLNNIPVR